jgi:uncharacterized protein (DUF1778 family)
MTLAAKEKLLAAAEAREKTVSKFVLEAALAYADEVLAGRRTLGLDEERWQTFAAAMEEPTGSLQRAAKLMLRAEFFDEEPRGSLLGYRGGR